MNKNKGMTIENKLLDHFKTEIKEYGALYVGNNINKFITSPEIDKTLGIYIRKKGSARQKKSTLDVLRGKFYESLTKLLLNEYFKDCKGYSHIRAVLYSERDTLPSDLKDKIDNIKLIKKGKEAVKKPDIDVIVWSKKKRDRAFFISVKGTARERIGQFLSNLFIFDPIAMQAKYGYKFNVESKIKFKIAFFCYDLARQMDLSAESKAEIEKKRKGTKQLEAYLIDDDPNISGGIYVPNNLYKLDKVRDFSGLVGRIVEFFNEK
jgi:hypothetical protein